MIYPDPNTGCWHWGGATDRKGYGYISNRHGPRAAHRLAWTMFVGEIPEGMWVLHRCDVPCCANPAHLFLGTALDNNADMRSKGRARSGERHHWSRLSAADVRAIRGAGGTQGAIAARFGVSQPTVSRIRAGRIWESA